MFYYKHNNKTFISKNEYDLQHIDEEEASADSKVIYLLNSFDPMYSRFCYSVSDLSLLDIENEDLKLLVKSNKKHNLNIPEWIINKINKSELASINTSYPDWLNRIPSSLKSSCRVNVIGLGDVGGTLVTGLRLLGGDCISRIGIYDIDQSKLIRWHLEANQIIYPDNSIKLPEVVMLEEAELFDCDIFVFCVTVGVPPIQGTLGDVRMLQFEGNSKIINYYAKMARVKNYKGIFAVVSDPVDLLCKSAFLASNKNNAGETDFEGLSSDQIRGYGLGVMHARALYYSKLSADTASYEQEGRAYGPHGEHLIIANSIENYDEAISIELTSKARNANMEIRSTSFKPYIAPALSSGAISIISTIKGQWHYSASYMGGIYMGAKNRLTTAGIELERLDIPEKLMNRITETYNKLRSII